MNMKTGMNWITPTVAVSVSKISDGKVTGTILKKDAKGSLITPLYNGNDNTMKMVQKYV